jgi:DNA-binding XRE family transcriptional regulator
MGSVEKGLCEPKALLALAIASIVRATIPSERFERKVSNEGT